jgi:hypothetical protein
MVATPPQSDHSPARQLSAAILPCMWCLSCTEGRQASNYKFSICNRVLFGNLPAKRGSVVGPL